MILSSHDPNIFHPSSRSAPVELINKCLPEWLSGLVHHALPLPTRASPMPFTRPVGQATGSSEFGGGESQAFATDCTQMEVE